MEHIGKYKGYNVYKVPHREMKYDSGKTLYAVAETGELVLKGEVVGKVNFNSGSVTEFDDHKCYEYHYPAEKRTTKRNVEASADDVCKSVVVDPTPLDEMIDSFIIAARKMTIEDYVGVFKAEV